MSVGASLRAALRDLYENSWRLVILNAAFSLVVAAASLAATYGYLQLLLLLAIGPAAAALMHAAVILQQTDELRLRDGVDGLRLHWKRGFVLGAMVAAAVGLAVLAASFYARLGPLAWPLAVVALYVLGLFALWQIHVWPLAVAERTRALRDVLRDAGLALTRRPRATVAFALAVLLVDAVCAIGILPVLTIAVAYSFLAAAHFALPAPSAEEATL
jgi:hypothetical protein